MHKNWSHDFYDGLFADRFFNRSTESLHRVVMFLADILHLAPGSSVLDQCCGTGGISTALAMHGYRVVGIDIASEYIDRAKLNVAGGACRFICADAGEFYLDPPADAGFNWWTSFGYSDDDAVNQRMLTMANRSIKVGGYFALDMMNALRWQKKMTGRQEISEKAGNDDWVTRYAPERKMIYRSWITTDARGERIRRDGGGVRLYSPGEMEDLLKESGFTLTGQFGDTDKSSYTEESRRMILVARKERELTA